MKKLFTILLICLTPYILFGQGAADFGDAPDDAAWWGGTANFPTLDASTGPKHISGDQSTFWIGDMSTRGANTTTMEDEAKVINQDEDDGSPYVFIMLIGIPAPASITVPITTNDSHDPNTEIYINVAIDVDNDLDFDNTPDPNWVVRNKIVKCPTDSTLGFDFGPFGFGSDLLLLPVWVRVTVTTEAIDSPWNGSGKGEGDWTFGETEDWWFGTGASRGSNARKGGGLPPPGGPPGPVHPAPNPNPAKCIKLIHPHTVYVKCDEVKCIWVGVQDCGSEPVTDINIGFNFLRGTALQAGPDVVGDPVKVGNTTWFQVCVTGWPCESEDDRWAKYTVTVTYDPDGLYVVKEFEMNFGNDELPMGLDDDDNPTNRVSAEPLDSTGFAPWFMNQGETITKLLTVWEGQYPGGGPKWLTNGQPQLFPLEIPSWAGLTETAREDDNTSATYTFSGTPGNEDNGLHYLVFEVSSTDPSDGFDPWEWRIPLYISDNNHPPDLVNGFDYSYYINVYEDESLITSITATDDDQILEKRDSLFFDWFLWDTDDDDFYDDASVTFTITGDSASLEWMPTRDDIGNYNLVGQVWDYYLSMDSTESDVTVCYLEPDFKADYTVGFAPHTVTFTDLSVFENTTITSYDWNFDDGGYSSVQNPVHTYTESGTYTVHLEISNGTHDVEAVKYFYIIINDIDFEADTTDGVIPFEAHFTNLAETEIPASITSSTSTSASFSWIWDFGDDFTGAEQHPIHVYEQPGFFTVSLIGNIHVYEDGELAETITSEKIIKENYISAVGDLMADFEANVVDGYAPLSVTFTDKSTGDPTSRLWTFGDGTPDATIANPIHVYEDPGIYNVSLTVYRDDKQSIKEVSDMIVARQPLVAAFSADPLSGTAPQSVTFTDESLGDPVPEAWYWDFGDGATSLERHPVHLYQSAGTYDVTLIVDDATNQDTLTKVGYIVIEGDVELNAEFEAEPLSGEEPLTVQFTDLSAGNPTSWTWDFGNTSGTSTEQNPLYVYENSGTYTISLIVSDGENEDTEVKADYITVGATGVYDYMENGFELFQNYPNPLRHTTTISYTLKYDCNISLKLVNLLGEEIRTFVRNEFKTPGTHSITWNGRDDSGKLVPAGVYYYELAVEGSEYRFSKTKELIIIR
ncbi:PKD domain-containing protein [Bacteroidota bacterium]